MKADYKNWVPKYMVNGLIAGTMTRPPKVRPKKSNFGGRYFYVKIQL